MTVANPREVPEYELNPLELQIRRSDGISKACPFTISFLLLFAFIHKLCGNGCCRNCFNYTLIGEGILFPYLYLSLVKLNNKC